MKSILYLAKSINDFITGKNEESNGLNTTPKPENNDME